MLTDYWNQFIAWLLAIVNAVAGWLLELIQDLFAWIWDKLLGALVELLAMIPVPQWLDGIGAAFGNLPCEVVFFLTPFQLPVGVGILVGATVLRFIIRRLPLVG